MTTWIFGYGSLVSPESLASTIGRTITPGTGIHIVELSGFGRRWNYGSKALRGEWSDPDGTKTIGGLVVSLGIVESPDESINGVIFAVSETELAELDRRESAYDRVDITDRVSLLDDNAGQHIDERIVVYFPRPSSVSRYQRHRDAGTAAIRRSYWDLVEHAFGALGEGHLDWYRQTPPPDVPIRDIVLDPLPRAREIPGSDAPEV